MNFDDNNPFAEPGQRQASGQSYSNPPPSHGYNPFSNDSSPTYQPSSPPPPPPVSPSAVFIPTPAPVPVYQPPVYTPTPPPPPTAVRQPSYPSEPKETSTRVDFTAAEQAEREKRLNDRERAITPATPIGSRVKNFPPLPKFCPCGPCFYHNISVEIPAPLQKWTRFLYILWIVYSITLVLNFIGALSYFIVDTDGGSTFGVSIVYLVLFVPLSYVCWYRPVYRAFRTDSSVYYMLFFFISVMFTANNALFATGFVVGMCGFRRLNLMSTNKVVGAMMLILGCLWALIATAAIVLTIRVHRFYRASGASIEQAQREIQTAIVNNPTVRGAARETAREVATTGINEALRPDGK